MAKVFLSAGHGGADPGAVGNGLKEKDINLQIELACGAELARHGVSVVYSRVKDENDPVGEEVREANASGASVAVSFHTNAGGGDGSESWYYSTSANGKKLAQMLEDETKKLGQNSRGIKPTTGLAFCKNVNCVAVLCECGFIDSSDIKIVDTTAEQKQFGIAYAKAILKYLGIAYKEEVVQKPAASTGTIYRVQVGAFSVRANAEAMQKKLREAGFDCYITS